MLAVIRWNVRVGNVRKMKGNPTLLNFGGYSVSELAECGI